MPVVQAIHGPLQRNKRLHPKISPGKLLYKPLHGNCLTNYHTLHRPCNDRCSVTATVLSAITRLLRPVYDLFFWKPTRALLLQATHGCTGHTQPVQHANKQPTALQAIHDSADYTRSIIQQQAIMAECIACYCRVYGDYKPFCLTGDYEPFLLQALHGFYICGSTMALPAFSPMPLYIENVL